MAIVLDVIRPGAAKPNPFTICIVANTALEAPWNSGTVIADPIIGQLPVFQAACSYINDTLFATLPGQIEGVLADSAVQASIRVISVYDDGLPVTLANALVAQDSVSEILVPIRAAFQPFVAKYQMNPDVIYAVSASATHTRASAWFTTDDDSKGGVPFTLDGTQFFHRYYFTIPGTIAIHTTATSLTALHEFGHAISSYTNGRILDLYVDSPPGFNVRAGRPIPPLFCSYQSASYGSDLSRDGLGYPRSWTSYHSGLLDPGCPAVMDDYWLSAKGPNACQHDGLTRAFILDRLKAKIARP